MISSALKFLAFCATTALVIPYTTALLCNTAYGWPRTKNKYRRAFNPRKIYTLNLAVIQQMILILRFLPLYLQFRSYYKHATTKEIMKYRTYGRNNQKLDLHFPNQRVEFGDKTFPVVVFVYGGAWSGGSKKMYGMVCSSIANRLGAIVCCPDFSRYPKGHVDNMVDDLIDCVTWLYNNVEHYSGDKNKIMMVGHSSGAHLCLMSVYELFIEGNSATTSGSMLEFQDTHFNGTSIHENIDNGISTESFYVVNRTNILEPKPSSSLLTQSSQTLENQLCDSPGLECDFEELKKVSDYRGSKMSLEGGKVDSVDDKKSSDEEFSESRLEDDSEDKDSVITVVKPDDLLDEAQRLLQEEHKSLVDLSKSIKAVVGLAGVYHIADHFQHESKRGVEDISSMDRAMYGPEHFDRFSPTNLYSNIDHSLRLPKFVLLHGTDDHVVPITSTTKFAEVLQKHHPDVTVRIIPNCDHYEICLDLNKPSRRFYETVITILDDTAKSVFT